MNDAGIEIAAKLVGSERVLNARRHQLMAGNARERILKCEKPRCERPADHQKQKSP